MAGEPEQQPATREPGRNWAVAGIVCGALALFIVPVVLAPLGMVFGTVGLIRGSRRMGAVAIGVSVLSLIIGLILNAILLRVVNA